MKRAYANNLEYLEGMGKWLRLRMERLRLRRLLDKSLGWRKKNRYFDEDNMLSQADLTRQLTRVEGQLQQLAKEQNTKVSQSLHDGVSLPLETIADEFKLEYFEKMALVLALAPTLDPALGDALGDIGHGSSIPEIRDVLEILCDTLTEKVRARSFFTSESPLVANNLVELSRSRRMSDSDFLRMDVVMPRRIAAKLLDEHYIDDQLVTFSNVVEPEIDIKQVVLPKDMLGEILGMVSNRERYLKTRADWGFDRILPYGKGTVLLFAGPPGVGKTMMAHALAKSAGYKLLLIDLPKLLERGEFEEDLRMAFMEARLRRGFIFFDEADELFDRRSSWMPTLLREFEKLDGVAILATNKQHVIEEAMKRRILRQFNFEIPPAELRQRIWQSLLPPEAPKADDIDLAALAEQFEFSGGYIKNAVLTALHYALQRHGKQCKITQADLVNGARGQIQSRLSRHTDKIIPRLGIADVALPVETKQTIEKLLNAARIRNKVFSQWGFAEKMNSGKAVTAIFTGPPGVGKSITAEAIAFELGQVLYPVNIASVLSMYVGETEKRLAAIFQGARDSDAVVFFDEADAFFNTRITAADTNGRHLNQQINILLMEIEKHNGIVILATNFPEAVDPAFERRIRYHIRFEQPGQEQCEAIWRLNLPVKAPVAADVEPKALARKYPYAGGTIRNIVLRAAFDAATDGGVITIRHIEEAASVEHPLVEKRRMGFAVSEPRIA